MYVARISTGEEVDFEGFSREHAAVADELHRLRDEWMHEAAEQTLITAPVSERVSQIVGQDMDVHVGLDQAEGESTFTDEIVGRLDDPRNHIGRYQFRGEVARGGQGAILRVYDQDLRRHLAMKVVLGEGDKKGSSAPASTG